MRAVRLLTVYHIAEGVCRTPSQMQMPLPLDADPLPLDADSLDDPLVMWTAMHSANLPPYEQNDTQM